MNNPAKSNHPADHYAGERTIDGLCVTVNGKALPTFECGAALPPLALLHADTAAAMAIGDEEGGQRVFEELLENVESSARISLAMNFSAT